MAIGIAIPLGIAFAGVIGLLTRIENEQLNPAGDCVVVHVVVVCAMPWMVLEQCHAGSVVGKRGSRSKNWNTCPDLQATTRGVSERNVDRPRKIPAAASTNRTRF